MRRPVYLDYHATTPVDPRVLEHMQPYFAERFGNPGSVGHAYGWEARDAVEAARAQIAQCIGASPGEIVFTSGATESNNLALRGTAERARKGRHILSVKTEHRAVLDPLNRLARRGFEVTLFDVMPAPHPRAGLLDVDRFAAALRPDTFLISVMLANNEIGVIQPIRLISQLCRERGVLVHCDATQAVGKLQVDVDELGVDLLSFTAHKIYGPKGIGALYVRREPPVPLQPQIDGGGQERGRRSGTLNVPGIVGFARALELCLAELPGEAQRLAALRDRLYERLVAALPDTAINGPALDQPGLRLPGNLNVGIRGVNGEALLVALRDIAVSSGSACTSADPEPSHVLRALGVEEAVERASLRFGLGRFTTEEEVEFAAAYVAEQVQGLRAKLD